MSDTATPDPFKLPHPPIVEAVLDIDCDLPLDLRPAELERGGTGGIGTSHRPQSHHLPISGLTMFKKTLFCDGLPC